MSDTILEVHNLKKYFKVLVDTLHAVDNVSFHIDKGETLGLVGENGCGKSTVGRVILRLISRIDGQVIYQGEDIPSYDNGRMQSLRKKMQIIFQDPYSCLDPRKTIDQIIAEPLCIHKICPLGEINGRVLDSMAKGGVSRRPFNSYPYELDGGRRQRVGIVRALALDPESIIYDEPVSSLDVSIQAQIFNLLQGLQNTMGLTYLLISHSLSVVCHISNRISVIYLGQMVEIHDSRGLFRNPVHPYTKALLFAVPITKYGCKRERILLEGDVPSPINPKPGCKFTNRCLMAQDIYRRQKPPIYTVSPDHQVCCHMAEHQDQRNVRRYVTPQLPVFPENQNQWILRNYSG